MTEDNNSRWITILPEELLRETERVENLKFTKYMVVLIVNKIKEFASTSYYLLFPLFLGY